MHTCHAATGTTPSPPITVAARARIIGVTLTTVPQSMACAFRRIWASADRKLLEISDANPSVVPLRKAPKKRNSEGGQPCDAGTGNPACPVRAQVNVAQPGQ